MKTQLKIIFVLQFTLLLSACGGSSSSDPLDLRNDAPRVRVSAPASVPRGVEVTLDGSKTSDVDGEIASYAWKQDTKDTVQVSLADANTSKAKFSTPATQLDSTDLHFKLTATDAEGKSASKSVVVHLIGSEDTGEAPTAVMDNVPSAVALNQTLDLDGSKSHDNNAGGEIVSWKWTLQQPDELNISLTKDTEEKAQLVTPQHYIGTVDFKVMLKVTDNDGRTHEVSKTIKLNGIPAYRVNGTVSVVSGSHMDSDINNPAATYIANDTLDTPQLINNPSRVVGYVNKAGAGLDGRSKALGDRRDFYKMSLLKGQTVEFSYFVGAEKKVGDLIFFENDFDLFVYDENKTLIDIGFHGVIVDVPVGNNKEEKRETVYLTAPETGDFLIEVYAGRGSGNYKLEITDRIHQSQLGELTLSAEFVPGEVIVKRTSGIELQRRQQLNQMSGLKKLAGKSERAVLYQFPILSAKNQSIQYKTIAQRVNDDKQAKIATLNQIVALRQQKDVVYAEPNYIEYPQDTEPSDPLYDAKQWHYKNINLPQAWDITTGDSSVVVAVLDTGIHANHPDIKTQLQANGYDFVKDAENSGDGDGIDDDPTDNSEGLSHGTHVAGTVMAASDNGIGVSGVTWHSSLMAVRVLGKEGGTTYDVTQGILYAAGLDNDSGIILDENQRADIINMSLGGYFNSQYRQDAIRSARVNDVVIVASSGNNGSEKVVAYPAAHDGVIAVGATDKNNTVTGYSNKGEKLDVVAPGGNTRTAREDGVLSLFADGNSFDYEFINGTSMAAPHVSGVIALMKAVYPQMKPDDVDLWLEGEILTNDLGHFGHDHSYGYGLIDAYKAVLIAQKAKNNEKIIIPARVKVSPQRLNFESDLDAFSFVIEAITDSAGNGEVLAIESVTASENWISLKKPQGGYGSYEVKVDRSLLDKRLYSGSIVIEIENAKGAKKRRIEISVVVNNSVQVVSVFSLLDVLLYDNYDLERPRSPVYAVQALPVKDHPGEYSYQFLDILEGKYDILAATDMDNDHLLSPIHFDPIGYPTDYPYSDVGLPFSILDVVRDIDSFDFSISIRSGL